MIPEIAERRADIQALCRRFGVQRLEIFGSAAAGTFRDEQSDLDFLVEFESTGPGYADRYFGLLESLEELYRRQVESGRQLCDQEPVFPSVGGSQQSPALCSLRRGSTSTIAQ